MLESISDAFYALDHDGRFLYVNHAAETWWDRAREALIGQIWFEAFPEVVGTPPYDAHLAAEREQRVMRLETCSPVLGKWIDLAIYPTGYGLSVYFKDITERRQAERGILAREAELARVQAAGRVAGIDIDLVNALSTPRRSPEYQRLHGLSPDVIAETHDDWLNRVHPDDRETAERTLRDAIAVGATYENEYRIVRPDNGETRWILAKADIERDNAGNALRLVGAHIDITERKHAERDLRDREERLNLAVGVDQLATWDWDIAGGKVVWSDLHYRMQGYVPGEIEPTYDAWAARVHPDDLAATEGALAHARDTREDYRHEFRVRLPDGAVRWMSAQGRFFYDDKGRPIRMIGAMRNVTTRRDMVAALRQSEQRLERVLESISDGLVVVGGDWGITYVNGASRQMLADQGIDVAGLIGQPFPDVYPGIAGTPTQSLFTRAMADREAAEFELFYEPWQVWHDVRVFPVREGGLSIYFHDVTARKAAEQALRDSQAELQRTLDSISDVFVMIDTDWRFIRINAAGQRQWQDEGVDPETAIGEDIRDVLPGVTASDFEKQLRKSLVLRVPTAFEHHVEPWGRWFACRTYPVAGGGASIYMLDVTERKTWEKALRDSEDYLARLVGSIGNRFSVLDRDWRWTFLNDEARAAVAADGHDPDRILGRVFWEDYPELLDTKVAEHLNSAMYERRPAVFELQRKDGWLLVNTFPVHDAGLAIYAQDVTAQKRLEMALRDSEARWRALTDTMPQLVWMASDGDDITYVNDQFVRYTGAPAEALRGAGWTHYLHPDDRGRTEREWRMRRERGDTFDLDCRLRRFDGEYRWFKARGLAVTGEQGRPALWYGTCTDIQDMVEARFRAEAADRTKSEFLANMSHEIRTPLSAIVGLTSVMRAFEPEPDRYRDYLRIMHESATSLGELITDVLEYAKLDADMVELTAAEFDLRALLEEVQRMASVKAQEKGLMVRLDLDGLSVRPAHFVGDPLRLKQIVTNLLSNAVKFTEQGGVDIAVEASAAGETCDLAITVSDSGIGIPADKIAHIFDKFTQADSSITRRFGGTGLGLAISKRLAEAMGGRIDVVSTPGQGSQFVLRLRLPPARPPQGRAAPEAIDTAPKGRRVLVVDDNPTNALVAGTMLRRLGYGYDVAVNGRHAIEAWRDGRYDIVLMDLQMPEVDGLVATRRIRQIEKSTGAKPVRIVAMTAHVMEEDRQRCVNAGMDDYIAKPFTAEGLADRLKTNLAETPNSTCNSQSN